MFVMLMQGGVCIVHSVLRMKQSSLGLYAFSIHAYSVGLTDGIIETLFGI